MRIPNTLFSAKRVVGWTAGLAFLSLAVPVALACVLPRNLSEQIAMAGDEIAVGEVVSFDEVWAPEPNGDKALWTVVDFRVQESLVSGAKSFEQRFFFRGGVRPGSESTSITPSAEDIRVGRELLVFLARRPFGEQTFGAGVLQLDTYAEVYRVLDVTRNGSRHQVVLGKGRGFAFPQNQTVAEARSAVATVLAKRDQRR